MGRDALDTELSRGEVLSTLIGSGLFTEVDFDRRLPTHLDILVDVDAPSFGSLYGKNLLLAYSLGLFGSRTTVPMNLELNLDAPGLDRVSHTIENEWVVTAGALHPSAPEDYREIREGNSPFLEILSQSLDLAVETWRREGLLCRPPRPPGSLDEARPVDARSESPPTRG